MKILGIIPARGGSKGIPKKNIKPLNGKPLIAYTIQQALDSQYLDNVIVSTDDEEIALLAKDFGVEVPFLRPTELATSNSTSLSYVIHALDYYSNQRVEYDAVCILQPTSPYRPKGAIDASIIKYKSSPNRSLISVRKVPDHYNPYWTFLKGEEGLFPSISGPLISRRQDLPEAFHRDGAIYILNVEFMRKEGKLLSNDLDSYEIESPALINIDTNDDWELAEKYF